MMAYSRLKRVLKQKRLSVPELHRRIRAQGIDVNIKSLYRLNHEYESVDRLDMKVAGAICQVVAVPLTDWIVFQSGAETGMLQRLALKKQAQLDELMTKNNDGALTESERMRLQVLVREAEDLAIANAQVLATQMSRLEPSTQGPTRAP
jgi:DNA-binding Xre family transcriptional regulator